MALLSRVSVLLALISRQGAAEELTAESAADRAVQASYDVAAARSTERAVTWAAGVAVTWSPTDIPGARARASEADARGDALLAQRAALRDAIAVEVVQYFESVRAADVKVVATNKQLESASEAYRVIRSLFANARATTSNVLDAETDLARARLAWVNARIDARIARARLDHAVGRHQTASSRH